MNRRSEHVFFVEEEEEEDGEGGNDDADAVNRRTEEVAHSMARSVLLSATEGNTFADDADGSIRSSSSKARLQARLAAERVPEAVFETVPTAGAPQMFTVSVWLDSGTKFPYRLIGNLGKFRSFDDIRRSIERQPYTHILVCYRANVVAANADAAEEVASRYAITRLPPSTHGGSRTRRRISHRRGRRHLRHHLTKKAMRQKRSIR